MEKQKRWQLFVIIAVLILTVYNILPTIFYYTKPLKKPIDEKWATETMVSIGERVNNLEDDSLEWLRSFCGLLDIKPASIALEKDRPELVSLTFKNANDAARFRKYLPRAGSLISFAPSQLSLYDSSSETASKKVTVQRRIPLHFDSKQLSDFFQFSSKVDAQGQITPLYRALISDRALQVGMALGGTSENARYLQAASGSIDDPQTQDILVFLSQNITSFVKIFGENSAIAGRYFASFTQADIANKSQAVQTFIQALTQYKDKVASEKNTLQQEAKKLQEQSSFLESQKQQRLEFLTSREKTLASAEAIVRRQADKFSLGGSPWNYQSFGTAMQESLSSVQPGSSLQVISLNGRNPFIKDLVIDWANEKFYLRLNQDLIAFKQNLETANNSSQKAQFDQFIYNEIAYDARQSGENISPAQGHFEIALSELQGSNSFLAMRLSNIADTRANQVKEAIVESWNPKHPDLNRSVFPVWDYETYLSLPADQQKLGLVVYTPSKYNKMPPAGFRMNSIYVIAKGVNKILQKVQKSPDSEQSKQFLQDFNQLRTQLQKSGFFGYSGASSGLDAQFANDFVFEAEDYFQNVLKATREDFKVHGTKRYAILEFSDVEQRILATNKIDTRIHEDLLKWKDDYQAAQLNLKGTSIFDVPPPTKNPFWSNLKLSTIKYFRGDDRKILHWGLDLSGGKTVQIELRDNNNRLVTDEMDIQQGINELYNRVNKMGVSEVSIRKEGHTITLDFPGSQGLSAAELVKASSMYFHVVNEKFTPNNAQLAGVTDRFLQEIWNEALITNRKTPEEINAIAWTHLYGDSTDPDVVQPRSEAAKTLYEAGLRLTNPLESTQTSLFNDTVSKIAVFRGSDFTQWHGQTHPLLIVFRNYALEGANLENIHASYDPSKGNFLSFNVKGAQSTKSGLKFNPRDDLHAWTSQFSKEKIMGTANETYSHGRGWRMAVILNGSVISAPTLDSALRDSAMISGSFTQREVNQLEADLKAGSLSFTPHILSEKNVSPELGAKERSHGILATALALLLVIILMVSYYRFAGIVASVAVLFNLLLLWATLQNLQATMTLAGIAGIILTLGMGVDANVLVFERIREEFAVSGRIASAIQTGFKKAFSAIIDSNLTTIIAALILLQFDSGPIKSFAVTLIIGIISSLFTVLFLTRFFFHKWAQNPEHKALKMSNFIKAANFNFLKHTKMTVIFSGLIIVLGCGVLIKQRHTLLGMDFTGGNALTLEIQPKSGLNYRQAVEEALKNQGATAQDFQIRELNPSNNIRIFLSRSLQQSGKPFFGLPMQTDVKDVSYSYENNPKIVWVVQALEKAHLKLTSDSMQNLDKNWSEISGQMSDSMRNSAIIGLLIALACIMVYITIRFEFKYAISATLCLAHDLLFTVAAMAILHALRVPIQIDMNTITALMTMIGYSLNDTIIVFDRIREDIRLMRKSSFTEIINHALNVTLSRTLMTSGTTLVVLLPLVLLGGSTLFGFALVMIIGVVFGTLSSLFIAAPLLQYFHRRELQKQGNFIAAEP